MVTQDMLVPVLRAIVSLLRGSVLDVSRDVPVARPDRSSADDRTKSQSESRRRRYASYALDLFPPSGMTSLRSSSPSGSRLLIGPPSRKSAAARGP